MPKRLFIAVDISDEAREIASGIIRELSPARGVSFVRPENLHITLKFLGDTDAPTEAKLVEMLQRISADTPPFTLRFDGPELLGKRVVSIKITGDTPSVFNLEKRIDTECERLGFKPEGRRFRPHLTLARIRDPHTAKAFANRHLEAQIPAANFRVSTITLYESKFTSSGTAYESVYMADLLR